MKLYKYGIYNGESYEDACTHEVYSKVKIDEDEWSQLLHELFRKGHDAYGVYKELLKTDKFFRLEDLICIEEVICSEIGMEFSDDMNKWPHDNPDACFRRKSVELDDYITYRQDYLIL